MNVLKDLPKVVDFSERRTRILGYLFLFATILHGVIDPGMTYFAVIILDIGVEVNPVMQWALHKGLLFFAIAHFPLYIFLGITYVITIKLMKENLREGKEIIYYLGLGGGFLICIWGVMIVLIHFWALLVGLS